MKEFSVFILSLIGVVCGMLLLFNYLGEKHCSNIVTEMGRNYRYDLVNGCRIQQKDGTYIYWEMYRNVNQ